MEDVCQCLLYVGRRSPKIPIKLGKEKRLRSRPGSFSMTISKFMAIGGLPSGEGWDEGFKIKYLQPSP
jgi:hypothetical protein